MPNFAQSIDKISSVPVNKIGIGLRAPYIEAIIKNPQKFTKKIGWFEVHSENYYGEGGASLASLKKIREDFPISLHSVGNSLGSANSLDKTHLKNLKKLIDIIDPFLVSDHISWGMINKRHLNDLLPLPYNQASYQALAKNIMQMQDFLKREILIENPSAYLTFANQEFSEFEFINKVVKQTGCKLLLDVNNIYVSACNNAQFDAKNYLKNLDKKIVAEIHLAGHSETEIFDGKKYKKIFIDTHKKFGKVPTLIEWDQDFPKMEVLLSEAKKAEKILTKSY